MINLQTDCSNTSWEISPADREGVLRYRSSLKRWRKYFIFHFCFRNKMFTPVLPTGILPSLAISLVLTSYVMTTYISLSDSFLAISTFESMASSSLYIPAAYWKKVMQYLLVVFDLQFSTYAILVVVNLYSFECGTMEMCKRGRACHTKIRD